MAKILIAEDESFVSNAYRIKLEGSGYEVLQAEDGEKAMKIMQESKPDLVILDLLMPIKNGFDVLAEKRNDKDIKDIPVIITSNLSQEEDIDKGLALGAKDYIIKTDLDFPEFLEKVAKTVKK